MNEWLKHLFLFAPDDGAGGGASDGGNAAETGQATGQQADTPRTFTQDDVNRLMGQTREEARRAVMNDLAEKYGDLDELKQAREELEKRRQAEMSEVEKLQAERQKLLDQLSAKEQEAKAATLTALRLKVGQALGLPPTLASRLQGETEEDIQADAEAVMKDLGRGEPGAFGNTGARDGASDQSNHGLSATERAAADAVGMSYQDYAAAKKRMGD